MGRFNVDSDVNIAGQHRACQDTIQVSGAPLCTTVFFS